MNERDEPAVCPYPRMKVDELQTFRLDAAQLLLEIAHFQRHVVDAFASLFEVARHSRIINGGRDKFNIAIGASGERGDTDTLVGQVLFDRLSEAEHPVVGDGLIEIPDDNSNVVKLEPAERECFNHAINAAIPRRGGQERLRPGCRPGPSESG